MTCPDKPTLLAFQRGTLLPDEAARVRLHLETCGACRRFDAPTVELAPRAPGPAVGAGSGADAQQATSTLDLAGSPGAASAPSPKQLGRYLLLARLGAGGMGEVFKAYDPELDRRVAVKLLRPELLAGPGADENRARMLREAQALARLADSRVVTVHDAGAHGDQVFLAMEYVEGQTLREWLEAGPQPWRQVLERFLEAGWGLAAAHAAGLVHRDFKPQNVLVARDGRVKVADFGLARGADDATAAAPTEGLAPLSVVTHAGIVLGTPAYMAPEQRAGRTVDARADQYAFSVALYEALYGRHPLHGVPPGGAPLPPPSRPGVPRGLAPVLLRGMASLPEARFPSMAALLGALAREASAPQRRRRALLAGALTVATATGLFLWRAEAPVPCQGAEAQWAASWSAVRAEAVGKALRSTGVPYANDAATEVARRVEDYGRQWVAQHTEACQATRLRGEQGEEMLDLRMTCLARRRRAVEALAGVLLSADARVTQHAVQAVESLPELEDCADLASLRAAPRPPSDPAVRARLEAARGLVDEGRTLLNAARLKASTAALEKARGEARALSALDVEAEALLIEGRLHWRAGRYDQAAERMTEASHAASAVRDEPLLARALIDLAQVESGLLRRHEAAELRLRDARVVLERLQWPERIEARYYFVAGMNAEDRERHAESLEALDRAQAHFERLPSKLPLIQVLMFRANPLIGLGRLAEAEQSVLRSLALREASQGSKHPELGPGYVILGNVLSFQGRLDEAVEAQHKALALFEPAYGKESLQVAAALHNLGVLESWRGNLDAALEAAERSRMLFEKKLGAEHPEAAKVQRTVADIWLAQGRAREALPVLELALARFEAKEGRESETLTHFLTSLGEARLALGQPQRAVESLERALTLTSARSRPEDVARTRFALGRALWHSGKERARARELVASARAVFETKGPANTRSLEEVRDWLATHAAEARRP
ncbi:protein kinase domain-containing protein [Pyxidicoccus xibeiensis]|uniref:protein kinase domain-containing protein n=1 Tax=Pyxidicoccus xibeiensis TaxID=2906759 RepID=UPI0020A72368|nr:tetratricopeptide repeat protein [Pyxidicoccus xibeiensis]MCP3136829.1 tetratricopeptide repeat protein [Pyxidicoccus xibeiensis]